MGAIEKILPSIFDVLRVPVIGSVVDEKTQIKMPSLVSVFIEKL